MKRLKKTLRRIVFIISLIIVALIPVPIFVQKKEGKFDNDTTIELVTTEEEDGESNSKTAQEAKF
ncbi:hypothetical protein [Aquimarina sp. RZ0]|uniref:hypothetical protein n=1 Tax=Aquimarina sp. RZ0 TaxID=2607730 RepID=UPI0011F0F90F|nr:hypothetical protein [Aquimarina sp. RZ0]KAA1246711.1 hypothetical protein F0000_06620 [Aquimarina sp. RZ0]